MLPQVREGVFPASPNSQVAWMCLVMKDGMRRLWRRDDFLVDIFPGFVIYFKKGPLEEEGGMTGRGRSIDR